MTKTSVVRLIPRALQLAKEYVDSHVLESLLLTQVAGIVGFSPRYLNRLFRDYFGCGFRRYLMLAKMRVADAELKSGSRVKEVCNELSLSLRTLERWYEGLYGLTPEERRQGKEPNCRKISGSGAKKAKLTP